MPKSVRRPHPAQHTRASWNRLKRLDVDMQLYSYQLALYRTPSITQSRSQEM